MPSPVLTEKARLLFPQLYPDSEKAFTASTGFLCRFCKWQGMKKLKISGEKKSADSFCYYFCWEFSWDHWRLFCGKCL